MKYFSHLYLYSHTTKYHFTFFIIFAFSIYFHVVFIYLFFFSSRIKDISKERKKKIYLAIYLI